MTSRTTAVATAVPGEIAPLAIGRRDFRGCNRSASRSRTSFTRYMALATRHHNANRRHVRQKSGHQLWESVGCHDSPELNTTAANTIAFLGHWYGRSAAINARTPVRDAGREADSAGSVALAVTPLPPEGSEPRRQLGPESQRQANAPDLRRHTGRGC